MSVIIFGHCLNRVFKRNLADINSTVLKGMQLPAETKKTGPRLEPKDAVTGHAAANTAQKPLKSQKENIPRYDSNDVHGSHSFTLCFSI